MFLVHPRRFELRLRRIYRPPRRRPGVAEIKVNWAFQGQNLHKEDTSSHYHIFVGDLSPEVNDEVLAKAFSAFGSMSDARVMWDVNSGKSRGYGFVAFRDKTDAEQAIATMNGEWLGSRAIRCNWANQKGQPGPGGQGQQGLPACVGYPGTATAGRARSNISDTRNRILCGNYLVGGSNGNGYLGQTLSYEAVVVQTPQYNSTVYVGNLPPNTVQQDITPHFTSYGCIHEVRMQADRGFAFVKLDTHENAAMAIVTLQGTVINGRPAKLSWGKDRAPDNWSNVGHYPQGQPGGYGAYGNAHAAPGPGGAHAALGVHHQQQAWHQHTGPAQHHAAHHGHHYGPPGAGSEYDLPPGMSAPPPSLASLDTHGGGAQGAGGAGAGWDYYGPYYSYNHHQQGHSPQPGYLSPHGATGTPGSNGVPSPGNY
ncbi:hypothetical protein BC936DRAFT_141598 [Jimgerdemannia flammicorona]|uniref:RRM domain-containing protein n=1 Tax=Jimgerdemannia flammicorona TaxID=994334 RepID=A0A433A1Y7_9FUNG|nr:hypothetical protein BC936DRAFT_141598 [Jimgerdemannia flammicorona]